MIGVPGNGAKNLLHAKRIVQSFSTASELYLLNLESTLDLRLQVHNPIRIV